MIGEYTGTTHRVCQDARAVVAHTSEHGEHCLDESDVEHRPSELQVPKMARALRHASLTCGTLGAAVYGAQSWVAQSTSPGPPPVIQVAAVDLAYGHPSLESGGCKFDKTMNKRLVG